MTNDEQNKKTDSGGWKCVDGNEAVAHVAYRLNDTAFIFPITPSSPMGEAVDLWAAQHQKNLFGQELKVVEMQSEAGAAGALHGALVSGSLATTFTASQGLLLYIPNLYKIAGELLPTVIHVASRALAGEALSIYGDHSDVMLLRGCGLAMVSSFSVQEAHDMAAVCQSATLNSRVPFLHFMDGFRTSHEINKIELLSDEQLKTLLPYNKVEEHRQRALSPMHPTQRGTAQAPDVFMQMVESSNTQYQAVYGIVEKAFLDFENVTGRSYKPFEYQFYGTTQPRIAIVSMGSSVPVVNVTLKELKSEQVCLIGVRLFRPWNPTKFCEVLPPSVTRIAVLDRTREGGAQGEPLYLDVCTSLQVEDRTGIFVAGGRYGLGSRDFTPRMVQAVINNMQRRNTKDIQRPFTVGINDDVTRLSLSLPGRGVATLPEDKITQCVFWGFGSDGTVGANKEAIKIIGDYHQKMSVQAYFEYDSKKSSGWTRSHLRFSHSLNIEAPFNIEDGQAQYVACHNESYVQAHKFDVIRFLKRRGIFFLNTGIASIKDSEKRLQAIEDLVSPKLLRKIALKNIQFYVMDAQGLARQFGLAGRINMICTIAFFRLSQVIPLDDAVALLRASIRKTYSYKGEDVVQKNLDLLNTVVNDPTWLYKIEVPSAKWCKMATDSNSKQYENRHVALIDDEKVAKFMLDIGDPVSRLDGYDIPISKFLENNLLGGVMITGTSKFEKRNPNPSGKIPQWEPNNCTQCNQCVFVCPHAAIRPFIVTKEEGNNAPHVELFDSVKAQGTELAGKRYSLQVSVLDCTGCNACVDVCPEQPKALEMIQIDDGSMKKGEENWNYAMTLPERGDLVEPNSVRGSQFQTPLMEFSGACSGCGETPYFKLLTQLFGERMVIANATGCSTIWGGSFPSNPYTTSKKTGRGPAWANSLFEDNAEYGLGMFTATQQRRDKLVTMVLDYVHHFDIIAEEEKVSNEEQQLVSLLKDWLEIRNEKSNRCTLLFDKMKPLFLALLPGAGDFDSEITKNGNQYSLLSQIWSERDMFPKLSHWIVGGDGWAYDIGFGGLDHVEAFETNDVNVLVVDTEMYSNTGGQQSKATPAGASVKFAIGGKRQKKKSIGEMFMTYEHVYVASVALTNQAQTLQAMIEADRHDGPSIIIAYAPCIQQGVRPLGLNDMIDEIRIAVDSGYWPLYRYHPELAKESKNPFILDSKKLRKEISSFLQRESRFINLKKKDPAVAKELWEIMNQDIHHRMEHLQALSKGYKAFDDEQDATVMTLYASETGNAQRFAEAFAAACTLSASALAMNDLEVDDIDGRTCVFFISTCGQGAMPRNGKGFLKQLEGRTEPFKAGTRFLMFGLGDSSYFFFVKAAKDVENRLVELGATKMLETMGTGDDSVEGGADVGLHDWLDNVWPILDVPPPAEVPHIDPIKVTYSDKAVLRPEDDQNALNQFFLSDERHAVSTPIISNEMMCREGYTRDFRTIRMAQSSKLNYNLGDAIEIFPRNDADRVAHFLHDYSPDFGEMTVVKLHAWGIDGEISLGSLFTYVLDLFGKPSKHFIQQLATFERDEAERTEMLHPEFLSKAAKTKGMNIADVLLQFKGAQPPLPALLSMIPLIKPRAYSIASSPDALKCQIELLVLIDSWWCDEGMRYGMTCNMLRQLKPGDHIWCRIHPGSMEPPAPEDPVVCAGIGSGLAPHMAFLRDRVRAVEAGGKVGPFSLFFGNRLKLEEFLFQEELEAYVKKYDWFKLHAAFSRDDPKKKIYVQDLVAQTDDARLLLRENSGLLYVCGNRQLPKPLQIALTRSFSKHSEDAEEIAAAEAVVQDLYIKGRAQQEVW